MPSNHPFLVGVTGGIGAGKTEACSIFSSLGRTVISADNLAKEIADQGSGAQRREILETFGAGAFGADGLMDRRRMADSSSTMPRSERNWSGSSTPGYFTPSKNLSNSLRGEERVAVCDCRGGASLRDRDGQTIGRSGSRRCERRDHGWNESCGARTSTVKPFAGRIGAQLSQNVKRGKGGFRSDE